MGPRGQIQVRLVGKLLYLLTYLPHCVLNKLCYCEEMINCVYMYVCMFVRERDRDRKKVYRMSMYGKYTCACVQTCAQKAYLYKVICRQQRKLSGLNIIPLRRGLSLNQERGQQPTNSSDPPDSFPYSTGVTGSVFYTPGDLNSGPCS